MRTLCFFNCGSVVVSVTGKELELLYPLMLSIHTPYSQVLLRYPTLGQQQLAKKLQDIKIVCVCVCACARARVCVCVTCIFLLDKLLASFNISCSPFRVYTTQ